MATKPSIALPVPLQWRLMMGFAPYKAAIALGISYASWARLESGRRKPTVRDLLAMGAIANRVAPWRPTHVQTAQALRLHGVRPPPPPERGAVDQWGGGATW